MIGGKVLRLVEVSGTGDGWSCYRIYCGRRKASDAHDCYEYGEAFELFSEICCAYFHYLMEGGTL